LRTCSRKKLSRVERSYSSETTVLPAVGKSYSTSNKYEV
jgi:hypothetical protein